MWVKVPEKLKFVEKIWGKGERKTFVQVRKSMARRGRGGRGQRARSPNACC